MSLIETISQPGEVQWLVYASTEKGKVERAEQQAVKFNEGKVWLARDVDWLPAFKSELFSFPHSKHDDQVDSVVRLLTAISHPKLHHRLTQFGCS